MAELWTILKALNWTADAFKTRGMSSARLEAEVLLAHVLGIERIGLYTSFDRPLSPREKTDYRELVKRRFGGEPCQYITGKQEFWSLEFEVSSAVLVPRPDTEVLVEEALSFLDTRERRGKILDVGAGSGAIAISLARECPDAELHACDISSDALRIASRNGTSNGVDISWVEGTIEAMTAEAPFDVIVSNPPYIPTATIEGLMTEVREFEPRLALDGGADGLVVFREILANAPTMLVAGGWLGFEVEGARQAGEIMAMLKESPFWEECRTRQDYSGLERVVCARRRA